MAEINVKEVAAMAEKFDNDVVKINVELKRVASVKCRLLKQKARADYSEKLDECLRYYQILVEAKNLLDPKEKPVTKYEQEDVDRLDYDETVKAIRSIQSKKSNTIWLTEDLETNVEFQNACRIEEMLKKHRDTVRPVDEAYIRRSDLQTIIDTIESSGKLSKDRILDLLKSL